MNHWLYVHLKHLSHKTYTFCQLLFTSLQLGFNIIQSISSIGECFNNLQLGFINFPKQINKVMKTFKQCFIFNNLHIFSSIAKCFQQFNFWFKQFSSLSFTNCKCFQHSTKQLNNLQNVISAIFKCIQLVFAIITMQSYHILYIAAKIYIENLLESN